MSPLESHLQKCVEEALKSTPLWPQSRPYFMQYGRLIRSQLFYTASKSFSVPPSVSEQTRLEMAASIELFQTFLLIHDDIADKAKLRRGQPSLYSLVGMENALIIGDLIYTLALQKISKTSGLSAEVRLACLSSLLQVAYQTGVGQLFDQNTQSLTTSTDILKMYENKTGFYSIYLPLNWALIISGKKLKSAESLKAISRNLGQAYQLIDDLENLGLSKSSAINPKDLTSDYRQQKRTLIWAELSAKKNLEWDFAKSFEDYLSELSDLGVYSELVSKARLLFETAMNDLRKLFGNESLLIHKFTEIYEPRINSLL